MATSPWDLQPLFLRSSTKRSRLRPRFTLSSITLLLRPRRHLVACPIKRLVSHSSRITHSNNSSKLAPLEVSLSMLHLGSRCRRPIRAAMRLRGSRLGINSTETA